MLDAGAPTSRTQCEAPEATGGDFAQLRSTLEELASFRLEAHAPRQAREIVDTLRQCRSAIFRSHLYARCGPIRRVSLAQPTAV